jgi:hypothetical protein
MIFQNVINQAGPLPVSGEFSAESDAQMVLFVAGSAWSSSSNSFIGIDVQLDEQSIGMASVYCNESKSHRALIPILLPITVSSGTHTITFNALNGDTVGDDNDYYNATLMV